MQTAVVLGLLSAVWPCAIDMFLPALPGVARSLQVSDQSVQRSVTLFFLGMGLGQMVVGPLSDLLGRKRLLLGGLWLTLISSVACALAPDLASLMVLQMLQGLGASVGAVIPRAVVRDLHGGHRAAQMIALVRVVFGLAPILAPLAGAWLIGSLGWRSVFWVAAAYTLFLLAVTWRGLPETRVHQTWEPGSLGRMLRAYVGLLRDRHFMALVLMAIFGSISFFAFLGNSSFLFIQHYGLTPTQYSRVFALNAAVYLGSSLLAGRLAERWGVAAAAWLGVGAYMAAAWLLLALLALGMDRLDWVLALLVLTFGALGLVLPLISVLALESHSAQSGTASALMGTLQFVCGAGVMALIGPFLDGSAWPMAIVIASASLMCLLLAGAALRKGAKQSHG